MFHHLDTQTIKVSIFTLRCKKTQLSKKRLSRRTKKQYHCHRNLPPLMSTLHGRWYSEGDINPQSSPVKHNPPPWQMCTSRGTLIFETLSYCKSLKALCSRVSYRKQTLVTALPHSSQNLWLFQLNVHYWGSSPTYIVFILQLIKKLGDVCSIKQLLQSVTPFTMHHNALQSVCISFPHIQWHSLPFLFCGRTREV